MIFNQKFREISNLLEFIRRNNIEVEADQIIKNIIGGKKDE